MQNIHTHAWDAAQHFQPDTIREADLSRGYPLDLTVRLEAFLEDMALFEKVVVFGLKARLTGYWVPDEYIANFTAQAAHKLIGFAACDPTQPGYFADLRYAVESLGLKGVKLGPMYAGFDPRNPICDPVYSYCQENGLPVVFHTGTTYNRAAALEYSRPWLFDEIAIRYPGLHMLLAHVAHPFSEECLVVIRKHPHVYADISALYYRPWQFYNTLVAAQEYRVTHKLLFGSDYPFTAAQDSIQGLKNVNAITGNSGLPRISDEVIQGILERDALMLLGVTL
jgi:predicted TIM-barrel fold metal-dependent hydrolase